MTNLSLLKTGKVKAIRFSTLDAICAALNCQPGDILAPQTSSRNKNDHKMVTTSRKTPLLAVTMAVLVPLYWFSEFGLFMERKFFPPATDVFRWGDAFTLVIMLLAIAIASQLPQIAWPTHSASSHTFCRNHIHGNTQSKLLAVYCQCVRWKFFAANPPTFDAYHPISFIMLAVSVIGLISASLLGLKSTGPRKAHRFPSQTASLMLFIAVIAPFLSLGMLLPRGTSPRHTGADQPSFSLLASR